MVPGLFYKNFPESLYKRYKGTILPMAVANFGHLTKLTFQCNFKCKTCWPDMTTNTLYVKSRPAP